MSMSPGTPRSAGLKNCTILCIKKYIFFFNSGRALCKPGIERESSGRARDGKGRAQHPRVYA